MTLLITVIAAIVSTVVWYMIPADKGLRLDVLTLMYWGASIMWAVDAVFEYIEDKEAYFNPEIADMVNDAFLGICVVALGMIIWLVNLLWRDPKGRFSKVQKQN